ncbi:unnamed protein product [Triticum turgidum subsp. durum]|uniref:Uncharacterized protein n=1 Tax=Triticum turgidum subsp. durum TaxID=4567 RepID=A0A9R1BLM7_TRITD|nr:unnamed protein product [Triticum turgidum subsp. durum]
MVMNEADVDADQRADGVAAPMVMTEAAADADHPIKDATTQDRKHGDDDGAVNVTPEEMRAIIEVIAETGKFWHDWSFLKRLLSLQLIQVLGEYSEAQMAIQEDGQQQNSLFRETHSELFSQLNDVLTTNTVKCNMKGRFYPCFSSLVKRISNASSLSTMVW